MPSPSTTISTSTNTPGAPRPALADRGGLSPADAAVYVGLSVPTLKKYRLDGTGPRYAKVGSRVVYRPTDLDAWLTAHLVGGGR